MVEGESSGSDRMISDSGGTTLRPQAPRFTNLTTTQSLASQVVAVQLSSPTPSTRNSLLTSFCERTKDISPPLIYTLCPKFAGSWSLSVMVLAER